MSAFGRKPRMLSELLPSYIDRSERREQFIQQMVIRIFAEAVGERISSQVQQVRFRGNTLILSVRNATWRQELHMQRPSIAARLNEKAGEHIVSDIRIVA